MKEERTGGGCEDCHLPLYFALLNIHPVGAAPETCVRMYVCMNTYKIARTTYVASSAAQGC